MRKLLQQGFTLIELLAVMAIIAILAAFLVPKIPGVIDQANVTACKANMTELHKEFIQYKMRFGDWPSETGIRFFLALWRDDPNSHDDTFAKRFTCPGVNQNTLPGIKGRKPSEWYEEWEAIDNTYTAYCGRDYDKYANLETKPGNEAIVADDNELAGGDHEKDARPNHMYTTVVLFANGDARPFEVMTLRKDGVLGPNQYLVPGPDCPLEELRKLRADGPLNKKKITKKKS
ncbi:MAG: type II secretion system protein [Planctomycetes bacterium]|nr:type II secretion system protein [Planctomycetota bacterium]